ncbi:hypothetical protein [Cupriavidus necator]|uniref:hypothetical protein n=1 Tax=Cupriavidus necator TaxID=106590 RepID=UPI00149056A2|nr:hypothetical protein [Cupriavidus necator]
MPAVSGTTGIAPCALATAADSAATSKQQLEVRLFSGKGMMVCQGWHGVGSRKHNARCPRDGHAGRNQHATIGAQQKRQAPVWRPAFF